MMSLLSPVLMLNGKRKEIFDIIFKGNMDINFESQNIAYILLDYDEDKLDELKQEVLNSNNPMELLKSKCNEIKKEKIDIPNNIQI